MSRRLLSFQLGRKPTHWAVPFVIGLCALAALLLLVGLSLRRGLNHDEHQFIAGGALIAREGQLPYRDFPYFHLPLLPLIYALLFGESGPLLLPARLLSAMCAWLTAALFFIAAWRRFTGVSAWQRLGMAAACVTLLLAAPLFSYTSGRAWNHDLAMLLAVGAFFAHSDGLLERRRPLWLGAGGLLLGLAADVRLAYGLLAPAFLLAIWFYPAVPMRIRRQGTFVFCAGVAVGMLPALIFLTLDPAGFWFGNVEYVRLNTQYYREIRGADAAMDLPGKLVYAGRLFFSQPGNWLPFALLAALLWPLRAALAARAPWRVLGAATNKPRSHFRLLFALALLPFALVSALVATPSQPQYYTLLLPWGVMAVLYALPPRPSRTGRALLLAVAVLAAALAAPAYAPGIAALARPGERVSAALRRDGQFIARLTEGRRVLTLAPAYPLEGESTIYPEFATGAFAWRVAPLLSPAERTERRVVGVDELPALLAAHPLRGLLVGIDNDDAAAEAPLVALAQASGFVPVELADDGVLWLAPLAEWAGLVRLGGADLPDSPLRANQEFVVTLYLQAITDIARELHVLVRVLEADGSELLRGEGPPFGVSTAGWAAGDVRADGHTFAVPSDAALGIYRIEVSLYDPATGEELGAPTAAGFLHFGDFGRLAGAPALAAFGAHLELVQTALPQTATAGAALPVGLVWRASAAPETDYTAFVHLLAADGALAAQADAPPTAGFYPTGRWRAGWPVRDEFELALPADLAPGEYTVLIGFYDPATMQRLPVKHSGGAAGDTYRAGSITIR